MPLPVLATKLFVPTPQPNIVRRPRLIERLNEGLHRTLTLVSAPAGFGKTTLVSEWLAGCGKRAAWLSLDEGENDPAGFLAYLVAALQTISKNIGDGVLGALQSPGSPPIDSILTTLLNDISTMPDDFILVLDDCHVLGARETDNALAFLVEHLPPRMHLVLATREDPQLPVARMRARGQLTELRAADLRFTPTEAADFLNQVMGLGLSAEDIAALEARTEGWIAGLQLAAISMRGHQDAAAFIRSFTGSHRFVLDYLVVEVLQRQSERIQAFLLRTSILDRLCGPLCDAVLGSPPASGQETLEYLERANLFIVPLDNERRWYRYHHLFAELLRQRLQQGAASGNEEGGVAEYHARASRWYEDHGLDIEAFRHAAAADDIERAERIIGGKGIPLHFRGAVVAILGWLASLPKSVLDARPSLCVRYASLLLTAGKTAGVEENLATAEAALQGVEPDDRTRDLIGQIAAARATLALTRYQPEAMLTQARRALEYLHPENPMRSRAIWTQGFAYEVQGDRAAARQAYSEAIATSQAFGNIHFTSVATISLGVMQEYDNSLHQAAETYRGGLLLAGEHLQLFANEALRGLARISYEWDDLEAAERYGQQSLLLARQYDRVVDRYILSEVFLARLKLARGDVAGAAALLTETAQAVRQNNFVHRIPEVAAAQVLVLLRQGDLAAAARLAKTQELPRSQARVLLAQGDPSAALALLSPLRLQMEAKGWQVERLGVMVMQAVAHRALGEKDKAVRLLRDALALAAPGGFIRLFVDEGEPMRMAISDVRSSTEKQPRGQDRELLVYVDKLLAAFAQPAVKPPSKIESPKPQMFEALSQRELEVLQLVAQGLSNHEIGERLFLALDTVKGHNRSIYAKLQVQRRTEAIARARELGLL
jgi:LuxR family transcriptional regulator, maltose regulon positive regulatory protein